MRARLNVLVGSVALAAALVACGGGGPSKADFTTKADGACSAGNSAISAVEKPSNAAQIATAAGAATATIQGQVASLRALKLPGGDDRRTVDGIIAAIGEVGAPAKALQDAAGKDDGAAMAKAATEMRAKADAAATQAQAYGLTQCGTGLKPALGGLFEGTKSTLKGTYVSKGEALCRESVRKTEALPEPGSSVTSFGRFVDRYLPVYTQVVDGFKALVPPPGDEETVGAIVGDFEAALPKIKEVATAAKANNPRLVLALFEELDLATTQIDAKLDAYGLKACGSLGGF